MPAVRVDGIEVAYDRVGQGPPLVLAHGATTDARLFRDQAGDLADEFTVVAWDEPGAGRSSDVPLSFTLADYARCLAAVIEDVDLGPAHVLGLSWGGTVVLELYRHHAGLVRTLLLVDTYAGWKGSLTAADVRARVEGAERMLAVPAEVFAPTVPGLFAGQPPAEAVRLLSVMSADARPRSLRTELTVMAEADQRDLLPKIEVPTLLLWGELDARSPVETVARQFLEAVPRATLVVLPGAGHLSNIEAPEPFNRTVREFCRAHS
ncbi:alpha/beta fold hydrolase [Streptomyces paradoxus]|uniref:alpha/beta fold hydrolase n=1 Tax=Streptomyces paradoxus TaxID=66375 RepID=UPI0038267899